MIRDIFEKCLDSSEHHDAYNGNDVSWCGMRNPSTLSKNDDLSCLTSSSTSSHDQPHASFTILIDNDNNATQFTSSYLPRVIDPREWHQPNCARKRKERQDSTSSITQDRKLVRSNSEEYLPNIDYEVIRRVSSHDEIKNSAYAIGDDEYLPETTSNELDSSAGGGSSSGSSGSDSNQPGYRYVGDVATVKSSNNEVQEILRETYRRSETSPARSRTFDFSHKLRVSPNHVPANQCSDELGDLENMRDRRSSERSCKARAAQPTRKSSSTKKSPSPLPRQTNLIDIDNNSMLPNQQNSYRYDIAAMKSECRGFTSSQSTEEATPFDFDAAAMQMATTMASNVDDFDDVSSSLSDQNDNNDYIEFMPSKSSIHNTMCQTLPWDFTTHQDDLPVKSQRFADNKYDHVNNSRGSDLKVHNESLGGPYAAFVNGENLKIREVMKSAAMPNLYTTPDEKLKHICKRLSTLKKRVAAFEESFELENGYRPSHSIKINDRFVKNAVAEMHKLRKEKQVLKADPMVALCLKPGSLTDGHKVLQMKETICEIEQRLHAKRNEEHRPNGLDEMHADQLVQEKTAVQRALLYLESLYGRPNTRDERDAARSLYNRYRLLKRLVNRSASITGSCINNPSELPTILEHEAMAFTMNPGSNSLTPPPSDSEGFNVPSSLIDSPTDPVSLMSSTDSTDTSSSINENVHDMSLDELSRSLEIVRDEKKKLRHTIKGFEEIFEEQNGRKMLKNDRTVIEDTYALYKQKKAKLRLLDALIRKQLAK